jgi:hypothetical protein
MVVVVMVLLLIIHQQAQPQVRPIREVEAEVDSQLLEMVVLE